MRAQVSVVIPTFNRVGTLPRALDSVLAQKGASFEVIVVDDGSTDGTKDLIRKIAARKSNLHYCSFQSNRGPSAARNLGIEKTRAPFVAFLDSDDEWLPGKLSAQLEFFEQNPDFLICQTEEIWIRSGKRVNPMKKHEKMGGDIFEKSLPRSIVSPSSVMMRREFFDRVGLFDELLPVCEDYDLWLRASARFPVGLIKKWFVIKYGGHPDQRSRAFPVMDRYRIRALLKLFNSDDLTPDQKERVVSELVRRCNIVSRGARKRGMGEEARFYEAMVQRFLNALRNAKRPSGFYGG